MEQLRRDLSARNPPLESISYHRLIEKRNLIIHGRPYVVCGLLSTARDPLSGTVVSGIVFGGDIIIYYVQASPYYIR